VGGEPLIALSPAAREHFLEVVRCPIVGECLSQASPRHPCAGIVLDQWREIDAEARQAYWPEVHQLPEPWQGHLELAPILFVSSNPSVSGSVVVPPPEPPPVTDSFAGRTAEEHPSIPRLGQGPKWVWDDEELVDRHESSFDLYIKDGIASRRPDGSPMRYTAFWAAVRKRAQELMPGRRVRPGLDYALTEVVRCKSRQERGVPEALGTCSSRYLARTLELSAARVFVVLGRRAREAVRARIGLRAVGDLHGPVRVGDRERLFAFLPHPNAHEPRSFAKRFSTDELELLREHLRGDRA
jgi:hypothetical protein